MTNHQKLINILDQLESDDNICCLWWAGKNDKGYGDIRYNGNGKMTKVHRISLEFKLGRSIKEGYFACHTCDTPACILPNHLYEGTQKDNMQDREQRNRGNRRFNGAGFNSWEKVTGESSQRAKLTNNQVFSIREMYATGNYSTRKLGRLFNVTGTTISNIVLRKTWKHI